MSSREKALRDSLLEACHKGDSDQVLARGPNMPPRSRGVLPCLAARKQNNVFSADASSSPRPQRLCAVAADAPCADVLQLHVNKAMCVHLRVCARSLHPSDSRR